MNRFKQCSYVSSSSSTYNFFFIGLFQELCKWIAPALIKERRRDLRQKMLCAVWLLATPECYRSVADRFGMSKGTLHFVVSLVTHALCSKAPDVIRWPEQDQERRALALQWQEKAGFSGVVGAIDGTHIPIPGPNATGQRDSFICRKGFPAMHLQVRY